MKHHQKPINQNHESHICPHLALKYDIATYAAFPSSINACYRGSNPATPKISLQRTYCLSPNYVNCPFNTNENIKKFPKEMRYRAQRIFGKSKSILLLGIFSILAVLVIFQIAFDGKWINPIASNSFSQSPTTNSASIREENSSLSTDTDQIANLVKTETTTLSAEILLTKSPEAESTKKPDPVLDLDTPIGSEQKFLIHRVLEGESLQYLADRHNTSLQAIMSVNENMVSPLWVGWIVVIPINTKDVDELPSFSAYQIDEEGITMKKFAEQLGITAQDLSFYNNIEEEHILHQGEWLLIPRN